MEVLQSEKADKVGAAYILFSAANRVMFLVLSCIMGKK